MMSLLIEGGVNNDILFGADGNDQLWGDSAPDAVTYDAQIIPGNYNTITYYWRERHVGLDGNDYLDGGAGDDQGWGGGGEDHLVGGTETENQPEYLNLVHAQRPSYRWAA